MLTHKLIQGTPEWHEFRANHFGASEAAAMLGLSKHISRNDLLLYKKTGKSKEYSDWVQTNVLDYGHEVEAQARTIFESKIGDELYPITCSDGVLSASCDGLTLDGHIAFEHKQWNESLVKYIDDNNTLPDTHMPQCQQILLVTEADVVVFVCSDGTEKKRIEIGIYPDQKWFERIKAGWEQFAQDLKDFVPKEISEKPEPAAIMQLPSLSIQIKGEVVASNLPEFKQAAEIFISGIKTDLQTDDDFVNAEATVKFCDETEKKLESVKAAAIGQTASIDDLMRTIDFIKESIRTKRLTLEKLVKTQKESIKDNIISDAYLKCERHIAAIHEEFSQINFKLLASAILTRQRFEAVCKNKRTLKSLHTEVNTEEAAIKIQLDDLARVVRKNLTHLPADLSLFKDLQSIITKPEEDFKLLVDSRLTEQKRKEEELAQRAIAEAKAKEEAEAARIAAAQELVAKRKEEELAARAVAEAKAKEEAAESKQAAPSPVQIMAPDSPSKISEANDALTPFDIWWRETGAKFASDPKLAAHMAWQEAFNLNKAAA